MEKPSPNDIAAFPELFDGLEDFFDEQASQLKRTGMTLTIAAIAVGLLFAWTAFRAA